MPAKLFCQLVLATGPAELGGRGPLWHLQYLSLIQANPPFPIQKNNLVPFPCFLPSQCRRSPPHFLARTDGICPLFNFFFVTGDTIQCHGGLRLRELCHAPMLLVFLTPRQALSSHPCQCFCASLKLLFFMIFVGVHEFSSKLTTFSSCRHRGSNR